MISLAVHFQRGDFQLAVEFTSDAPITGLVGPSGAGKSTLLHVIAGVLRAQRAHIEVDGVVLEDTAGKIRVPTHRRRIGLVFQQGLLFPHLDVGDNLQYGYDRTPVAQRRYAPSDVIALLRLGNVLDRPVQSLSGGERQRVALGRAVLASPRILLCDEPLSQVDQEHRVEILAHIATLSEQLPIIYVTHDHQELARLTTQIFSLNRGRLQAQDGESSG